MNDVNGKPPIRGDMENHFLDGFRQLMFPPEFRINAPLFFPEEELPPEEQIPEAASPSSPASSLASSPAEENMADVLEPPPDVFSLATDLATCLWYLKTKYFKQNWEDEAGDADDPRTRRALGRLNKAVDGLVKRGFEVQDPTNKRFPQGGEAMMRPIQFTPKAGLTFEQVTETVVPVIFYNDRLVQRGEVFVAVPLERQYPGAAVDDAGSVEAEYEADAHEENAKDKDMPEENN